MPLSGLRTVTFTYYLFIQFHLNFPIYLSAISQAKLALWRYITLRWFKLTNLGCLPNLFALRILRILKSKCTLRGLWGSSRLATQDDTHETTRAPISHERMRRQNNVSSVDCLRIRNTPLLDCRPGRCGLLRCRTFAVLSPERLFGRLWLLQTTMSYGHENMQGSGVRKTAIHLLQNMLQARLGNQDDQLRQICARNALPGMSLHGL